MDFFGLKILLNSDARAAGRFAVSSVAESNPGFRVHNASLRAEEENRYIFAVFYSAPAHPIRPGPYLLVSVSRDLSSAEVINPAPDSPYWIRGRK